ncbi:ATPase [Thermoclostridium stercorarium subsp. leptospartum DSM 9219]|uniref:Cd(2+)-exporting ATPase n=1 Tax=Thermoclostridium stercorarium subsp. leptospartum DSM 9219 TaxID=1346611 RepID=A0A1B1YIU3_THEST|nr:heavy metal translocating P-type ATPase [Thermoclostridium stercorarium]ANX00673.1 ATPase [Thermoclostridium stercorarium subsp. leptospartum DSM 9219]
MKQKEVLCLENLNCSHCANEIEREINNIEGVKASLNFMTKLLTIEYDGNKADIINQAEKIIHGHEPGVKISKWQGEDFSNKKVEKPFSIKEFLGAEHIIFFIGTVIYITAMISPLDGIYRKLVFLAAYLLLGGEVIYDAARNIFKGQVFDENFLMAIATIGAMAIGEYAEGVAVMLFYQIGEFFQEISLERSRRSISELVDIRPDYANLVSENSVVKVSPDKVQTGDIIIVKPGERIPLDGTVIEGSSSLDMSSLTGESVPKTVKANDEVYSGSVNMEGLLKIKVTKPFHESTAVKILDLVQNSATKKAPTEKFITRFAKWYTPAVVIIAIGIALFPPLITVAVNGGNGAVSFGSLFSDWFYRALIFLVASCPCALVISIPLGFFGGIGLASKNGILVKGGNYLEALTFLETVVFDKTGTLTKGEFEVIRILPADGVEELKLLQIAAAVERYSNHPIAKAIVEACPATDEEIIVEDHRELPGFGVVARYNGQEVMIGNKNLMDTEKIEVIIPDTVGSVVYVAVDRVYAGSIVVADIEKPDSRKTIESLKKKGIKTAMLTGDLKANADEMAGKIGIDEVYSELLPQHKVEILEKLMTQKNKKKKIAYVGDGMNDAPVLARADVGIAMGGLGTDAAIEAADIVIMNDEPLKLLTAINIAHETRKIVYQNIFVAFAVKFIVLAMGAGGLATMWEAVFADVGVALIAVVNAMRLINFQVD